MMKTIQKKLPIFAVSSLLFIASTHNIFAAGTASGIDISNQATVDYEVGGVNQNDIDSNTVTFKVDAAVDIAVTALSSSVNVIPGVLSELEFTVKNDGNETYDFDLVFEAGTVNFTTSGLLIYVDTNGDGLRNDTQTATIDNVLADGSVKVWLVGTIPATATNTQTATYHLMATAKLEDGNPIPAQISDDPLTKQYVYADAAGTYTGDVARDAKHSVSSMFTVQTAVLSITKSSNVIWDPINLGTAPLRIPGAIIEYTITISNGNGAETASAIVVTDVLDSNLITPPTTELYEAGSSVQITAPNISGGSAKNLTDASGDDEGTVTGQTVTVTGIELLANESAIVKIRAEID